MISPTKDTVIKCNEGGWEKDGAIPTTEVIVTDDSPLKSVVFASVSITSIDI